MSSQSSDATCIAGAQQYCLTPQERVRLVAVAMFGFISLFAVVLIFALILRFIYHHGFPPRRDRGVDRGFARGCRELVKNPLDWFMVIEINLHLLLLVVFIFLAAFAFSRRLNPGAGSCTSDSVD